MTARSTAASGRKSKEEIIEAFRCSSIEDAAIAVVARRGAEHATIQEIADEAGIAKGTIYLYFRDREELLSKTAGRALDRLLDEIGPALEADAPIGEKLLSVITTQLRFFDANSALLRATMALTRREDGVAGKKRAGSFARYAALVEQMFTLAKSRGEIRDFAPRSLAAIYRDCVRGIVMRRLEEKTSPPPEEEARLITSLLLRGIEAPRPKKERV